MKKISTFDKKKIEMERICVPPILPALIPTWIRKESFSTELNVPYNPIVVYSGIKKLYTYSLEEWTVTVVAAELTFFSLCSSEIIYLWLNLYFLQYYYNKV